MIKNLTSLKYGLLYCFAHFSVEVACFYYLFNNLNIGEMYWWIIALLYDALAFLPQSLMGAIADKFPKICYGAIGFIVVLICLILPFSYFSVMLIALGNALVHVDGAEKTLLNSGGKITPNALFVGGGSFGVITGRFLGKMAGLYVIIPLLLVILCVILLLIFTTNERAKTMLENSMYNTKSAPNVVSDKIPNVLLTIIIIFAVAVRGYIGYAIPTAWSVTNFHLIILYCYMGFGKMIGGVAVDKFGYKKATILSIVGALPFLLFGNAIPIISLTGVLLYSMSMPITIGIVYSKFPSSPAFAFGITTIGLFIGSCPEFFFSIQNLLIQQVVVTVLSVTALILILISLKKEIKNV